MAAPKKSTSKKTSEPEESTAPVEEQAVEPAAEAQPAEEAERRDIDQSDEPRSADSTGATSNEPQPWRVETYGDDAQWGWRLCAANGNIIRESGTFFESRDAANEDAEASADTSGAIFVDRNPAGVTTRGWR